MREILAKLQELLSLIEQKNKELDGLIEKSRVDVARNTEETSKLNSLNHELIQREVAVGNIEEITRTKADAIILKSKVEKAMEEFKKDKDAFDRAAEIKTAQIIRDEKANAVESERLKAKERELEKEYGFLNIDKAKVKEIMNKLNIK